MSIPGIKAPQSTSGRDEHKRPKAEGLVGKKKSRFALAAARNKKGRVHEADPQEDEPHSKKRG